MQEYVESNKLTTPFKNNRPGKKWVKSFMKHNRMSSKKTNIISSARQSTTSNPFLSSQIWNLDESGFPTDAGRCKIIAPKGEVANKITL